MWLIYTTRYHLPAVPTAHLFIFHSLARVTNAVAVETGLLYSHSITAMQHLPLLQMLRAFPRKMKCFIATSVTGLVPVHLVVKKFPHSPL